MWTTSLGYPANSGLLGLLPVGIIADSEVWGLSGALEWLEYLH